MNLIAIALLALSTFSFPLSAAVETDLTEAKALFFDRKYEESRAKWAAIVASKGPAAENVVKIA